MGYAAKPETCRLFPFNRFAFLGDTLIVAPHSELCPLELSDRQDAMESDHEALVEAMALHGIAGRVQEVGSLNGRSPAETISVERDIRTLADGWNSRRSFLDFVSDVEALERERGVRRVGAGDAPCSASLWRHIADLLLVKDECLRDPGLVRLCIAVTMPLRVELLVAPVNDQRHTGRASHSGATAPLLALYAIVSLAKDAGMDTVTYQTVTTLFRRYRPLIDLLSLADMEVDITSDRKIPLTSADGDRHSTWYLRAVQAIIARRKAGGERALGSVITGLLSSERTERMEQLLLLARRLQGLLSPHPSPPASLSARRVRAGLQRWVIRHCDADLLSVHLAGGQRKRDRPFTVGA
jgi:hypothetical protein